MQRPKVEGPGLRGESRPVGRRQRLSGIRDVLGKGCSHGSLSFLLFCCETGSRHVTLSARMSYPDQAGLELTGIALLLLPGCEIKNVHHHSQPHLHSTQVTASELYLSRDWVRDAI